MDSEVWAQSLDGCGVAERAAEIFGEIAEQYEFRIDTMSVMKDHVHLFVSAPPRYAPAQVVNIMKSLSAKKLFEEFPQVKKKLWAGSSGPKDMMLAQAATT